MHYIFNIIIPAPPQKGKAPLTGQKLFFPDLCQGEVNVMSGWRQGEAVRYILLIQIDIVGCQGCQGQGQHIAYVCAHARLWPCYIEPLF